MSGEGTLERFPRSILGPRRAVAAITAPFRDDAIRVRVEDNNMSAIWCLESPVVMVAGETRTFTITYVGQTTVSSPSAVVYKGTTDVSSTVMPTGSASASGNVVTLKPVTALVGGETYVVVVTTTIGANTDIRKFEIQAVKASDTQ